VVLPPELKLTTPPPISAATMTTKSVAEAVPPTPVAPRRAGAMALVIQTVTGQRLAVDDAIRTDTLARLRARISLTHGIAAGTQRLMIDQVTLEEGPQTLAERGIGPESALFLSLQAANHLITERQRAVAAAETAVAEADTAVQGQVGALPQPRSRLLLYRDDGSLKHRRWFHLSRDAEGVASVSWGKNEDGSNHMLWASCGSTPPKSCEVHGLSAEDGPAGVEHGFRILRRTGQPLLVAAADGETREKWVGALDAVQSQREAVGALEQPREALRQAPAEAARLDEEAREAQRFVEEVEPLLTEAERQMGAEEFGAAVVTLRRALTLDGANKEAWAALDRVAFVLSGRIYAAGDDGRLDLAGQELGREGVAQLARWLATDAGAAVADLNISEVIIGDAGATLVEAISASSSLEVITIGKGLRLPLKYNCDSDVLDAAGKGIEAGGATVVAWWLKTAAAAAISSVLISNNFIFGSKVFHKGRSYEMTVHDVDANQNGWNDVCEQLKSSSITSFTAADIGMGPVALRTLTTSLPAAVARLSLGSNPQIGDEAMVQLLDALKGVSLTSLDISKTGCGISTARKLAELLPGATKFSAALNFLTLSSTGDKYNPKTYTLTAGEDKLELNDKRLGPADVNLVSVWLATDAGAAVADLNISEAAEAIIGDAGPTLIEALSASSSMEFITIGKGLRLPLKDNYDSHFLDAVDKGIEAGGATVVAWWLTTSAAAVVTKLVLSECPLTGRRDFDEDLSGVTALFDALKTSSVTELDLRKCRLGPGSMAKLAEYLREATAALTSLALGSNPVGDEAMIGLIEALKDVSLTSLDISSTDCGVSTASKLAELLSGTTKFSAAITRVVLKGNVPCGRISEDGDGECPWLPGKEFDGWNMLCESFTKSTTLTDLDVSDCYLGPQALTPLTDATKVMSAVNSLILDTSTNSIFGDVYLPSGNYRDDLLGTAKEADKFATDCEPFWTSLKTSNITSLSLKSTGIGPVTLGHLSDWVRDATAASVEVIKLDGNPVGCPSKVSLKLGATTGVAVEKGVFASVGGRISQVIEIHSGSGNAKLRWLDDGSESGWTETATLTEVVAERTDLIEDYSHIQALGEALSEGKVKEISLAGTKFSGATLTEFVQSVRWETAAVESIDLSGCGLTGATRTGDWTDTEWGMQRAWENIDSDLDGFVALCAVLGKVRTVRLANCGLGASSAAELSKIFSDATAALTQIDLRGHPGLDRAALELLRAAAPTTCNILAD
jgi:hypothetical protein